MTSTSIHSTGDPEGEPQESRVSRFCLRFTCMHGLIATTQVDAFLIYQHFMNAPSHLLISIPDLAKSSCRSQSLVPGVPSLSCHGESRPCFRCLSLFSP